MSEIDLTTEDDLQKAVARILKGTRLHDGWFHYPAENPRRGRGSANAKAKGVKNGVPDVMIFEPVRTKSEMTVMWAGLAIELKMKGNKPSDEQEEWLERLRECGWRAEVCYSLDAVLVLLEECYGLKVVPKSVSDLEGLGRKR